VTSDHPAFRVMSLAELPPYSAYDEMAELLESAARMLRQNPTSFMDSIGWRLADAAGLFAQKALKLNDIPGVHEYTGRGCAIYPPDPERRFATVDTGARQRTALYRHFDAKDRLLYIGISLSAIQRLAQHSQGAAWFEEITRVEVQWFGSRKEASDAEVEAIRTERPLHNLVHNTGACPTCGARRT
jgi:predicted GIY-YIG superfamily endonuclease